MLNALRRGIIMLCECTRMSLQNILSNRVRSFLTLLGIMIGVTAVITLITTVSGVSGTLSSTFLSMGAGTLSVSVSGSELKSGMTADDLKELSAMEELAGITPNVSLSASVSRKGEHESNISVSGKSAYYFRLNAEIVKRGRALHPSDDDNRTYVCLIDQETVDSFFYGVDPLGETLFINGIGFSVVGLLNDDGDQNIMELLTGSPAILIPYTTALKMNNASVVNAFTVYTAEGVSSETAETALTAALDEMFSFEDDCYKITTMAGIEETMETMLDMMSALLAGIASIALLVGGIGIMNMMLTTVTERTMEIGLKKALGAIAWQIQLQFLIESFMLSMLGGLAGVLLGILLSLLLCDLLGTSFVLSLSAIFLGVGFSAAVGILFGWAPARKASRLNPIDALRSM